MFLDSCPVITCLIHSCMYSTHPEHPVMKLKTFWTGSPRTLLCNQAVTLNRGGSSCVRKIEEQYLFSDLGEMTSTYEDKWPLSKLNTQRTVISVYSHIFFVQTGRLLPVQLLVPRNYFKKKRWALLSSSKSISDIMCSMVLITVRLWVPEPDLICCLKHQGPDCCKYLFFFFNPTELCWFPAGESMT